MIEIALTRLPVDLTDEALAAAACDGDRAAFETLIDRYRDIAFAYAASMLGSREDAEDVAQEAFVRAYLALDRFRPGGRWAAWLMRIIQNLCRDVMRRRAVRRIGHLLPTQLDNSPTPEQQFMEVEGRKVLLDCVMRLPEKFRIPLLMRFAHQRSYKEIALAVGVPESTVVGRLAGALRILRRQLKGLEL